MVNQKNRYLFFEVFPGNWQKFLNPGIIPFLSPSYLDLQINGIYFHLLLKNWLLKHLFIH